MFGSHTQYGWRSDAISGGADKTSIRLGVPVGGCAVGSGREPDPSDRFLNKSDVGDDAAEREDGQGRAEQRQATPGHRRRSVVQDGFRRVRLQRLPPRASQQAHVDGPCTTPDRPATVRPLQNPAVLQKRPEPVPDRRRRVVEVIGLAIRFDPLARSPSIRKLTLTAFGFSAIGLPPFFGPLSLIPSLYEEI